MMWPAGTPARRRPALTAAVMRGGPQTKSVARGDVGHEPAQLGGREQVGAVAQEVVDLHPALAGQRVELAPEEHVARGPRAVDQRDLPGRALEVLQERAQRGDADAAGDERDPRAASRRGRELAARALDEHPGTGPRTAATRPVKSPLPLTVTRSRRPSGASDRESPFVCV